MMSITKPNSSTQDSGKVRLGAIGRSLPTQDSGKVRLGAIGRSLPTQTKR